MASKSEELEKAGWVRVNRWSSFWKAPDDIGPTARKYLEGAAHSEMTARKAAKAAARAAAKAEKEAKAAAAEGDE